MNRIYTGIGSREAPAKILQILERLATHLQRAGYTLRSGGARGCDSAFERGAGTAKEIYLPEKGFNNNPSSLHTVCDEALVIASKIHPAWGAVLKNPKNKFYHGRNVYQVLGLDLNTPTAFVVCWTPDGAFTAEQCTKRTGGTATAIRLASSRGIPVFNVYNEQHLNRIRRFIAKNDLEFS